MGIYASVDDLIDQWWEQAVKVLEFIDNCIRAYISRNIVSVMVRYVVNKSILYMIHWNN